MCKHGFTFTLNAHLVFLHFGKIGCKHAHINYFLSGCIRVRWVGTTGSEWYTTDNVKN